MRAFAHPTARFKATSVDPAGIPPPVLANNPQTLYVDPRRNVGAPTARKNAEER
jgi:hypothetical protein